MANSILEKFVSELTETHTVTELSSLLDLYLKESEKTAKGKDRVMISYGIQALDNLKQEMKV